MGQAELRSSNVLLPRADHFAKGVANSNVKAGADDSLRGATEPPLPVTPERLELIKAYAKGRSRSADEVAASRIAKRFAPRAPTLPLPGYVRRAALTPPTSLPALTSGIRTLLAVLIVAALLPNLALAVFWLGLVDRPWSEVAAPGSPAGQPVIPSPVLSAPSILEALQGETLRFPIALDGTDGVPDRSIIVIKGLPPGSTLSDGYAHGEAEWRLNPDEIGDLRLVLADAATGESTLSVQLVAADDSILAATSTTLRTRAEPNTNPAPYEVAEEQVSETEATEPELGFAVLETASVETVPLPDRRPAPPETDIADANWIKPTAYVNLRQGPSSTAPVVTIVAKGAKLRVIGRKHGWVQVRNPRTSQSGWIYASNADAAR